LAGLSITPMELGRTRGRGSLPMRWLEDSGEMNKERVILAKRIENCELSLVRN
jgi:hypothetical protein